MNFDIAGAWGIALIAAPLLLLLFAGLAYGRGEAMAVARPTGLAQRRPHPPAAATSATEPTQPARERTVLPGANGTQVPRSAMPPPAPSAALAAVPSAPHPAPRLRPVIPVSQAQPPPVLPELPRPAFEKAAHSAVSLAKSLGEAEAAGQGEAVADLKVALGIARFREGASAAVAANDVRDGLIMAMKQGRVLAQAHARIALGDLCKAGDDPTTACEHWQLARDIFAKAGEHDHRKAAEARMRANGCPTDWVLNDF